MFENLYKAAKLRYGGTSATDSMGQWICDNTTIKKRPFSFEGYEFQRAIADDMHPDMSVIKCSQIGLALSLDTPIATPTGWTTMGAVQVGDQLFDEQGQVTEVTYKSPIYTDHDCYRITFDDGEQIVADGNHKWKVESLRLFNSEGFWGQNTRAPKSGNYAKSGIITTRLMAGHVKVGAQNNFKITNAKPIVGSDDPLPIDPYFLGLWLGDGSQGSSIITSHYDDAPHIQKELEKRGFTWTLCRKKKGGNCGGYRVNYPGVYERCTRGHWTGGRGVKCLECERQRWHYRSNGKARDVAKYPGLYDTPYTRMTKLELNLDKHIPYAYLYSNEINRRELLSGLLDSDGSVNKAGQAKFTNTNPKLIGAVHYLLTSLGLKPSTHWNNQKYRYVSKDGIIIDSCRPCGLVLFSCFQEDDLFRLPRKRERLPSLNRKRKPQFLSRQIVSIEPVTSIPVQCLTVAADSHLFLAGEGMIPTCNTEVQIRKFLALLTRGNSLNGIFSLPSEKLFTKIYQGRIKPIVDGDQIFNPETGHTPVRRKDQIQIRDSFGYITGCGQDDATAISSDFLFHDEVDLSPQDILSLYQSRVQNSDMQITQRFSTPSFMNFGIDKFNKISDQREYVVRCSACNHYQIPRVTSDFIKIPFEVESFYDLTPEQIGMFDYDELFVKCEHCHRPLDLTNPDLREWVATYPTRQNARGYHVRPFSTSRLKPRYIFSQLAKHIEAGTPRHFANTVLGEPYTDANAEIQRGDVEKCMKGAQIPTISSTTPVYMGIDVGFSCYITLHIEDENGLPEFVLFEIVPHTHLETRVGELRRIYTIVQGAIDRFPFEPTASGLREMTNGVVMPVQWRGTAGLHPQKDELGNITHYSANQSLLFDSLHSQITQQKLVLRGYTNHKETVIQHLCDMLRIEQPDSEAQWQKRTGADHFFHSMAFSKAARRISEHMYQSQTSSKPSAGSPVILGCSPKEQNLLGLSLKGTHQISRLG